MTKEIYFREILPDETVQRYFNNFIISQGGNGTVTINNPIMTGDVLKLTCNGVTAIYEAKK